MMVPDALVQPRGFADQCLCDVSVRWVLGV